MNTFKLVSTQAYEIEKSANLKRSFLKPFKAEWPTLAVNSKLTKKKHFDELTLAFAIPFFYI